MRKIGPKTVPNRYKFRRLSDPPVQLLPKILSILSYITQWTVWSTKWTRQYFYARLYRSKNAVAN